MKANEAPEKIYLTKNLLGELRDGWDALPAEAFISIEYTRTDAFIEKACEFLKEHREEVRTEDNGIAGWIPERFIEDFKEYMNENNV